MPEFEMVVTLWTLVFIVAFSETSGIGCALAAQKHGVAMKLVDTGPNRRLRACIMVRMMVMKYVQPADIGSFVKDKSSRTVITP
jgi:hypothetical protein